MGAGTDQRAGGDERAGVGCRWRRRVLAAVFLSVPLAGCRMGVEDTTPQVRGDRAFARGEVEEALAEYLLAVREDHGVEATLRAAHVYAVLGRVEESLSLYQEAILEDSAHAGQAVADLVALAKRARDNRDDYGVAYAMEAALRIQPGLVAEELVLPLADHYSEIGEHARALPLYMKALGTGRDEPDIVLKTARAHKEIGDCERALVYYQRFRGLEPRREAEALWHEGWCSYQLAAERGDEGDLDEALRYWQMTVDIGEPRRLLPRAYFEMAQVLVELGLCDEAVEAYRMVPGAGVAGSSTLALRSLALVDAIRFGGKGGDGGEALPGALPC